MRSLHKQPFVVGCLMVLVWVHRIQARSIEINVEVAEVDHVKAASLGVEWLNTLSFEESPIAGVFQVGPIQRLTPLKADVRMLIEEGAAELLANPNLVTDSGTTATFHAGGQIPYITSSALGSTHVEFKPYGVMLEIRPQHLDSGHIELQLRASVSAPDQTNGVVISGTQVPALFERELSSNVTLRPDTTVTLAGLLQTQEEKKTYGVPMLRSIPIIGAIFRWRRTSFRRSTIIMFVTPHVVTL